MELSMQPRLDCRLSDTDKPGGINWTVRNTGIGPAVFVNGYLSLEDNSWDLRDHSQLAGFARHLVSSSINSRPLPANLVFVEHRGSGYYQEAKTDWHVFQFPPGTFTEQELIRLRHLLSRVQYRISYKSIYSLLMDAKGCVCLGESRPLETAVSER